VSEGTDEPLGRAEAFGRLRDGLAGVANLAEQLDGADDDRERRRVLLVMIQAAWQVRDQATDAYAALELAADEDGIARGVLE
jgi:hypothetical protein